MPHDECVKQEQWGEFKAWKTVVDDHLKDSDGKGGYRDRVTKLEHSVALLPYVCVVCSFCGSLLGKAAPEALKLLVDFLRRVG